MSNFKGRGVLQITGRTPAKSFISNMGALKRLLDDLQNTPVSDILLNEGKIYGARYYTAEPIGGNWLDMESWCLKTFGEGSRAIWGESKAPEPALRWYMNNRKFWFRNERDRTLFVLKWL